MIKVNDIDLVYFDIFFYWKFVQIYNTFVLNSSIPLYYLGSVLPLFADRKTSIHSLDPLDSNHM